jgi:hypothetical protein
MKKQVLQEEKEIQEKNRYSDEELEEFRQIIVEKLEKARRDLKMLDITITETLRQEGIARELINRIQNLRKDKGFEVTDKIKLQIEKNSEINTPIENNFAYICSETLADSLDLVQVLDNEEKIEIEIIEGLKTFITIQKMV